jgi:TPR repeat protein
MSAGHPAALYIQGRHLHSDGPKAEQEMTTYTLYSRAALKKEYLPAQYELAMCFARGVGIKKDRERAARILTELAQRGYTLDMHMAGTMVISDCDGKPLTHANAMHPSLLEMGKQIQKPCTTCGGVSLAAK